MEFGFRFFHDLVQLTNTPVGKRNLSRWNECLFLLEQNQVMFSFASPSLRDPLEENFCPHQLFQAQSRRSSPLAELQECFIRKGNRL